jgi:hypothetical protein
MKRLALVLLLAAFVLMVIVPFRAPVTAQEEDPTATLTPNPTTTYEAAVARYSTVAQKNVPNVIVLSMLCLILVLVGVGAAVFAPRKKRP